MGAPGFLAVFSDPGNKSTLEEFQDWYDNEHVPLRLDHLPYFLTGARYSAIDDKLPGWLAMYEIEEVESFQDPSYAVLRETRSEREKDLIARLGVLDRRTAEVVVDTGDQLEKSTGLKVGNPSRFVLTVGIALGGGSSESLERFAEDTRRVGGWVRTRVLKVFDKGVTGTNEEWTSIEVPDYLAVIELTSKFPEDTIVTEAPLALHDLRQWSLYKAFPALSQA
ncbi:hypothetical protein D9611_009100 [Ephemerocybe angulata]|uniref:EthD domain-containing protein n=1 Tax=Ephemerocybe angulata TaxID=980116 RepID=A0A8H5CEQ9_9AGAR|nr:hypothetical protein D9611_009100 [Tulosesus angulatus]